MAQLFPTIEQLRTMPMPHIRGLNIVTKEQENLVQSVINERLEKRPVSRPIKTSDVPLHIKSKEEELKWQKILDERRAQAQVQPVALSEEARLETKVTELQEQKATIEATIPQKFCDFCTSKGKIHKLDCKRIRR